MVVPTWGDVAVKLAGRVAFVYGSRSSIVRQRPGYVDSRAIVPRMSTR